MATFSSTTSEMAACATETGAAELPEILLTPGDIDGAVLELPFERHTKHALRFWLLCRNNSAFLINKSIACGQVKNAIVIVIIKLFYTGNILIVHEFVHRARIAEVLKEGKGEEVVDVDGSYLYKKHKALSDAGVQVKDLVAPPPPVNGWITLTHDNCVNESSKMPPVTSGTLILLCGACYYCLLFCEGLLYNYLAGNIGRKDGSEGAFRALSRGYTVWASGRVDKIDVNSSNPLFCHVRCVVKASMKAARYNVCILLKSKDKVTSIE